MCFSPVLVKMGGAGKLLPTAAALEDLHLLVKLRVAIKVVCSEKALSTVLAEEPLVRWVWVGEEVVLKLVEEGEARSALRADVGRGLLGGE